METTDSKNVVHQKSKQTHTINQKQKIHALNTTVNILRLGRKQLRVQGDDRRRSRRCGWKPNRSETDALPEL